MFFRLFLRALKTSSLFTFISTVSAEALFIWMCLPALAALLPKKYAFNCFIGLFSVSWTALALGYAFNIITLIYVPFWWMTLLGVLVMPTFFRFKSIEKKTLLVIRWVVVICLICIFFYLSILSREPLTAQPPDTDIWRHPRKICSGLNRTQRHTDYFTSFRSRYTKFHREMMQKPIDQQRILVYEVGDFGLGNRLQAILSAFILSVQTKRAFLLHWKVTAQCTAEYTDLFEDVDFGWIMKDYNIDLKNKANHRIDFEYKRTHPLRWASTHKQTYEGIVCDPDLGIPSDVRVVHLKANSWFLPAIMLNSFHQNELCEVFSGADKIYELLSKWLFRPVKAIQAVIDNIVDNEFKENRVVGIQIRATEVFAIPPSHLQTFARCAKFLVQGHKSKFFLATDSTHVRELFRDVFGSDLVEVFTPNLHGLAYAIIDMWLLGESDNIIVSPGSTFGAVAHARSSVVPFIVNHFGQCVRMLSSQPCFHYYFGIFKLKCWNPDMLTTDMLNNENCFV